MNAIRITYDPEGDILYVTFGHPTGATGYQLSDQVLLRVDPQSGRVAGLTVLNYSVHAQSGNAIAMSGLGEDPEVKSRLMAIIASPPISHFLRTIDSDAGVKAVLLSPSLREAVAV